MKREPKVNPVLAWAEWDGEQMNLPLRIYMKRTFAPMHPSWLIRVEIRPAPKRRKARKAKRS